MKLATFQQDNRVPCIGAVTGADDTIVALQAAALAVDKEPCPHFEDMLAFLRGGAEARSKAQEMVDRSPQESVFQMNQVTLLAPVPVPESVRDCMTFEAHIINTVRQVGLGSFARVDEILEKVLGRKRSLAYRFNKAFYQQPLYYKSNRFSVVGPGADVRIPFYGKDFDYELEWGIFIGKQGVNIPKGKAHEHIGGYTIFNDFSSRHPQLQEQKGRLGPTKGKDFDTGNAMGPFLVTPDEIPDPYGLTMKAGVNGEERSLGTTGDMYWTFEDIISYVSRAETLYPGEFIGSGTCSGPLGRGCGLETGQFLKQGDVVELEVEKIGVLTNTVV